VHALSYVLPALNPARTCIPAGRTRRRSDGESYPFGGILNYLNCIKSFRFIYSLFLAIDANFRLKRKAVSSDRVDPGLCRGWAYFNEEQKYKAFVAEFANLPQEASLSLLSDIFLANKLEWIAEHMCRP
jgi:hypothetical protein